jgi:hypothetical protein
MSTRQTWILATAAVLAALVLGAFLGPRTAAQRADQPKPEAAAGRYQAVPLGGNQGTVLILDTATGHCWSLNPGEGLDARWRAEGFPPRPNK